MDDVKQMPILADGMVLHCGAPNGLTMCKIQTSGMVVMEPGQHADHYKQLGYTLCDKCNTAVLDYIRGVATIMQEIKAGLDKG